ncbi:hypothetical protein JMN32_17935 [Fulvivirga sp. 29W222]|uniref:MACPF-like domain-containing protein n=1 Tax=Fulvivirga marina TaxID=2494733 RepID=A0A937G1D6_9BACT|nr:MAC/perforin domain-containing protein [Fulvivirga marina]MBL6448200.1 hypothetical protein [Fulvivirga marina]
MKLITVNNTNSGADKSVELDINAKLSDTRKTLENLGLMSQEDFFLENGKTEIEKPQEPQIPLSEVVYDGKLTVGSPQLPGGNAVDRYNQMSVAEKNALFSNIQIFRGLTVTQELGFGKTFKDLYYWKDGNMPAANNPRILTEVDYSYTFNKVTSMLTTFGSDSGSISFESPYASAEANFKYEQEHSTSSEEVTEYLNARFIVRKVELDVAMNSLSVNPEFIHAIEEAVKNCDPNNNSQGMQGYSNLLEVLNEWGYYVPLTFTLGGVLYSSDTTKITEFSDAESKKEEFGGSFKAAFDGIGGGGSYQHAQGSSSKTTSSSKFQDITIDQVGGAAGSTNDYNTWAKSLDQAINWNLASASKLLPSLVLVSLGDENAKNALNTCLSLLNGYNSVGSLQYLQPYLNMGDYSSVVSSILNPFG